ncbi:hypothetical protein CF392_15905 [Tamilnaduibacter salinus]|uniref:Uncharacterized protein n=1 Tax=Tamilnaduibacter salinus TaxID=1484056 RepID=A0A2A2I032_9GAMM|nr:hypothetical protein CF392_15905 [Tamilnaduibacter salinus]
MEKVPTVFNVSNQGMCYRRAGIVLVKIRVGRRQLETPTATRTWRFSMGMQVRLVVALVSHW